MRVVAILLVIAIATSFTPIVLAEDSWTFEKVWYRGAKKPSIMKAYKKSGTLSINGANLRFHAGDFDLEIPIASIQSVVIEPMKGDRFNRWAIIEYETEGASVVVGFKDGKRLGHGTDTVAIRDVIQRVLDSSPSGVPETTPPIDKSVVVSDESITWKEFRKQLKYGFPAAPKTLITDPAGVGVLLIDGDIKRGSSVFSMDGIGLVRTDDESRVYRGGQVGGRRFKGVVMFTGLKPGGYSVRIVRGSNPQGWFAQEIPEHPDLTFHIEAGRVHYHGPFRISKAKRNRPQTVEWRSDPEREAAILSQFAEKYADSPWAALATGSKPVLSDEQ